MIAYETEDHFFVLSLFLMLTMIALDSGMLHLGMDRVDLVELHLNIAWEGEKMEQKGKYCGEKKGSPFIFYFKG